MAKPNTAPDASIPPVPDPSWSSNATTFNMHDESIEQLGPLYGAKIDDQKTGFLDLPAELRNRIYEMVLVHPRQIILRTGQHYGRIICVGSLGLTPNILRSAKFIRDEATPVLYGSNSFNFNGPSSYKYFMKDANISGSIKHIRHVKIDFHSWGLLRKTGFLQNMESLQELSLNDADLIILCTAKEVLEEIRPILQALNSSKRKDDKHVADIIQFYTNHDCEDCVKKAKETTAEVRQLIRRYW